MKKPFLLLILIVLGSCASKNKFRESEFKGITKELNTTIENGSPDGTEFLRLFGIDQPAAEVSVNFDHEGDFKITYRNNYLDRNAFTAFKGKFRKNYYEIYLERKNIVFPPVYWMTNVNRIRIGIANDSTIVVERYWNRSGMILIMSAGTSNRSQYSFKQIKTKKSL